MNVNSELFGIDLNEKIILISQYICFEAIQNVGNSNNVLQTWNRGPSSNFVLFRSANHVWFTEECVMYWQKQVLIKKYL